MKHSALIQERILAFTPSLAKFFGVNGAVIVQQLKFLLSNPASGCERDGNRWVWNTYEQWQAEHFPFWSVATIKRAFQELQDQRVVETAQFDGYQSRKKYYRLNVGMLEQLTIENAAEIPIGSNCTDGTPIGSFCALPSDQNEPFEEVKLTRSLTETSTESTTEGTKKEKVTKRKGGGIASQEEVEQFATSIHLPKSDGTAMFWHFTEKGWRKNWQATIRKWKEFGYLPSQKSRNGSSPIKPQPQYRDVTNEA